MHGNILVNGGALNIWPLAKKQHIFCMGSAGAHGSFTQKAAKWRLTPYSSEEEIMRNTEKQGG